MQLEHMEYRSAIETLARRLGPDWIHQELSTHQSIGWSYFARQKVKIPAQGWKLHLSIAAHEAMDLIERVLPALSDLEVHFKLPSSLAGLIGLNGGQGGVNQVGKIVTVYPGEAVSLPDVADALDRLWPRWNGPRIPTDQQLRPDSAVFLRYGDFTGGAKIHLPSGLVLNAVRRPDGALEEDRREASGETPTWAPDPGLRLYRPNLPHPSATMMIAGRSYLPMVLLQSTAKGRVTVGMDLTSPAMVVIKTALRGIQGDRNGIDATDRLSNEFELLKRLHAAGLTVPRPLGFERRDEGAYLVIDYIEGEVLSALESPRRWALLPQLAELLARLHTEGLVYRDLKPPNVVVHEQHLTLIDFEFASSNIGGSGSAVGTRGYLAPEQADAPVRPSHDVFSLGVVVASCHLPLDPSLLPSGSGRLIRLLQLLNLPQTARIVRAFTHSAPESRPSAARAAELLRQMDFETALPANHETQTHSLKHWVRRASWEAGRATARYAITPRAGQRAYRNAHFLSHMLCEGINLGSAGVVLGLRNLDQALGRRDHDDAILETAHWLAHQPPIVETPGLLTGDAGVALALATATTLGTDASHFARAALLRLETATQNRSAGFDLFSGSAGVLWTGLLVEQVLGDGRALEIVKPLSHQLLNAATAHDGVLLWPEPGKKLHLGAAHGSAGIAMTLALWGEHTGDGAFLDMGHNALHSLFERVQTQGWMGLPAEWDGGPMPSNNWCHGAGGYLWTLLQLQTSARLEPALRWAKQAFLGSPALGSPTYCHGLAGQLELCLMLSAREEATEAHTRANAVAENLRVLCVRGSEGWQWASELGDQFTPDLWIGFLGPATALARWAAGHTDALLSSASMRRLKGETL